MGENYRNYEERFAGPMICMVKIEKHDSDSIFVLVDVDTKEPILPSEFKHAYLARGIYVQAVDHNNNVAWGIVSAIVIRHDDAQEEFIEAYGDSQLKNLIGTTVTERGDLPEFIK